MGNLAKPIKHEKVSTMVKFSLRRVRLNTGGYEYGRYGKYYGQGVPLYRAISDETGEVLEIRQNTRKAAKMIILQELKSAQLMLDAGHSCVCGNFFDAWSLEKFLR